jgi:hypothetical protein
MRQEYLIRTKDAKYVADTRPKTGRIVVGEKHEAIVFTCLEAAEWFMTHFVNKDRLFAGTCSIVKP